MRWLFRCTRARTRRRFGPEFDDLLDEMAGRGDSGFPFLFFDALRGISLERWATRTIRHAVVPLVAVAGLTLWAVGQGSAASSPPNAHPTRLAYDGVLSRPLDLPGADAQQPTACPTMPSLSAAPPSGVLLSPPTVAPSGLWTLSAGGETHRGGWCSYPIQVLSASPP